nr:PREDICTED: dedicator of cytokinesis protein 9-like [Bos mutus]
MSRDTPRGFLGLLGMPFEYTSPYTNSTPNINSVRNADSRGSLISTDSGNSLPERNSEKSNSLEKRERLLRRHSACVVHGAGEEEEESDQPARRHRATVDFSLLMLPPLPEEAPLGGGLSSPRGTEEHQQSGTLGNSVVRCDKLDQSEIKSLLMCFLYILKSMSDDALFTYWNKASTAELMDFFTISEVCLHQFQYMGKRYIARYCGGLV